MEIRQKFGRSSREIKQRYKYNKVCKVIKQEYDKNSAEIEEDGNIIKIRQKFIEIQQKLKNTKK